MSLVLNMGVDNTLLETRKLVLEKAGHTVVAAMAELALVSACRQHVFDVVVIGQAISRKDKQRVLTLLRQQCPAAKVLELYPASLGRSLETADHWLFTPTEVPQELAERVAALVKATVC